MTLTFTERLNPRLSKGTLVTVPGGRAVTSASAASDTRLIVRPDRGLPKGAYRIVWHSVAADDGHGLDGFISLGVQAAASGGHSSVTQSPFARDGWLRVLARALMYTALLLFAGALTLRVLLGRRGRSWLVPNRYAHRPEMDAARAAGRERTLIRDLGFLAAGAAAASASADAVDAAGGFSLGRIHSYLLSSQAGTARFVVVALALLAALLAARRPRVAALLVIGALAALAASGHAASASSPALSILVDWVHLVSGAVWLGGIALIVVTWGPSLRTGSRARRLAVARDVLPVFGRIALPAFVVVVASGGVSAVIELGSVAALWQTDYGRVLVAKMVLVGLVAGASYVHVFRLRPRIVAGSDAPEHERLHWRLLRTEPVLGLGIVAAVALLVAFPLPPRELAEGSQARAAVPPCSPCALPSPQPGELAVAEQGGSDMVAGWLRRGRRGLSGTVRVYATDGSPATDRFTVADARELPCGRGCKRFFSAGLSRELKVIVRQRGRDYVARLTTRWRPGEGPRARRLVGQAQVRMRGLRTVHEHERVSSVPGFFATTAYRLKAPDRFAWVTNRGVSSVTIGATQWTRPARRLPWTRGQFGGGLPFRTRSWFTWTTYARETYLLQIRREGSRRVAVVALMDPGTPAWWRLYIDLRSHLVLRSRLITNGHFMDQRFSRFNAAVWIEPPRAGPHGP